MYRTLILVVALVLTVAGAARAGSLEFYESSVAPGVTKVAPGPFGPTDFTILYDASTSEGEGILGFSELEIRPFGSMVIEGPGNPPAVMQCTASNCVQSSAKGGEGVGYLKASAGDFNGEGPGTAAGGGDPNSIYDLGVVRLSAGAGLGELRLITCNYTGADFSTQTCNPFVLIRTPEPGTFVLLGAGLAGLAFARRRTR